MKIIIAGIVLFIGFLIVLRGGDTDPVWYDDYYDHDVSGLLEED